MSSKIQQVPINPLSYIYGENCNSIYIDNVNESEIVKIITGLKNSSSGHDGIKAGLLKETLNLILVPLTHVFRLSISQGYFPDDLKIARLPLYLNQVIQC